MEAIMIMNNCFLARCHKLRTDVWRHTQALRDLCRFMRVHPCRWHHTVSVCKDDHLHSSHDNRHRGWRIPDWTSCQKVPRSPTRNLQLLHLVYSGQNVHSSNIVWRPGQHNGQTRNSCLGWKGLRLNGADQQRHCVSVHWCCGSG